jgi:hypothetical protein
MDPVVVRVPGATEVVPPRLKPIFFINFLVILHNPAARKSIRWVNVAPSLERLSTPVLEISPQLSSSSHWSASTLLP